MNEGLLTSASRFAGLEAGAVESTPILGSANTAQTGVSVPHHCGGFVPHRGVCATPEVAGA